MMQCDMCGAETYLVDCEIEGTTLKVCKTCSKHGTLVQPARAPYARGKTAVKRPVEPELIDAIKSNYSEILKKSREKKGLKQEELAKTVAEKESVIHKLESGHMEPSMALAKKLEHALHIKLIEKTETLKVQSEVSKSGAVTLGDVIKVRKRK